MKRRAALSNRVLGVITIAMLICLVPLVATIFLNPGASQLCISIFLILLEIEFLFVCFIPVWKLLILLKRNTMDKQLRFSHFLTSVPFFFIGGFVSIWSVLKLYQETNTVLKDYKAGAFTYYYQGKFPGWVTYSIDNDHVEFTDEIMLRYFLAGLWGFSLELGILMLILAFILMIRPALRKA